MVEVAARAFTPTGRILILAKLVLLALAFLGVAALTRAVTPAELRDLRRKRAA